MSSAATWEGVCLKLGTAERSSLSSSILLPSSATPIFVRAKYSSVSVTLSARFTMTEFGRSTSSNCFFVFVIAEDGKSKVVPANFSLTWTTTGVNISMPFATSSSSVSARVPTVRSTAGVSGPSPGVRESSPGCTVVPVSPVSVAVSPVAPVPSPAPAPTRGGLVVPGGVMIFLLSPSLTAFSMPNCLSTFSLSSSLTKDSCDRMSNSSMAGTLVSAPNGRRRPRPMTCCVSTSEPIVRSVHITAMRFVSQPSRNLLTDTITRTGELSVSR